MNPTRIWTPELLERLRLMYWREGHSTVSIARAMGLSVKSVASAFVYYGIPRRTRKEAAWLRETMGRGKCRTRDRV
jgi:hypothetical protein